ncbi:MULTISPECIES: hypothetical protein [unclassified Nocardioides]|uniref:hypothetical protein n=1 Tax=unclassified Nocardioides TaxID=2615069 RepID=UPI000056FBC4|nr:MULTISPECIES: hypothetical protein [unclassified Nocardioides]ABL80557.1 hypothetical protein Noca_1038 [Nocardioides sp. JS614]
MTNESRTRLYEKADGSSKFYATANNNWTALLKDRTNLTRDGEAHLCTLLGRLAEPMRKQLRVKPLPEPTGLPWLTPVLGSGCLGGLSPEQSQRLKRRPREVIQALEDSVLADGSSSRNLVASLVTSLITSRIPDVVLDDFAPWDSAGHGASSPVAETIQAVALLQRAQREALALSGLAVGPTTTFQVTNPDAAAEIQVNLMEPALVHLGVALGGADTSGSTVLAASRTLLEHFKTTLEATSTDDRMRLSGRDLDVLVEIAWLLLIEPVGVYPGWRDLVASAAVQMSDGDDITSALDALDVRQPRLRVNSLESLSTIGSRLAGLGEATLSSFEEKGGDRHAFFDAIAEILKIEAERDTPQDLLATAFVTSFDMELEMALVRRRVDFTVLMPYYYVHEASDGTAATQRATPLWLATHVKWSEVGFARVDAGDDSSLPSPVQATFTPRWRLVKGSISKSDDPLVVVRLVGSPLMPAPSLEDAAFDVDGEPFDLPTTLREFLESEYGQIGPEGPLREGVDLIPSLVLDEYTGLHHILASASGSFPLDLTRDPSGVNGFRYWTSVGVQFDDALVRLMAASYLDSSSDGVDLVRTGTSPSNRGVIVNRNLSPAEADVMTWQGFDAVRAQYSALTSDLVHYAVHLKGANAAASFKIGKCKDVRWPGSLPAPSDSMAETA